MERQWQSGLTGLIYSSDHLDAEVRGAFFTMDSAELGLASLGCDCCTARVFRQEVAIYNIYIYWISGLLA
jgi:hypothetical protein